MFWTLYLVQKPHDSDLLPLILLETNIVGKEIFTMIWCNFGTKFGYVRIIIETLVWLMDVPDLLE